MSGIRFNGIGVRFVTRANDPASAAHPSSRFRRRTSTFPSVGSESNAVSRSAPVVPEGAGEVSVSPEEPVAAVSEPENPDVPGQESAQIGLVTQLVRFALTGALSAVVDFGLYVLLLEAVGLPVNPAKAIGFIAGTTTAYLINRRWTFDAEPSRARFVAVVILYALTFCVQVGINWVFYHAFDEGLWWRVPVAYVIAQGTATVINFVVQRLVIFRIR